MAGKARVHELAKELGVTSKEVLARLSEQGEFVKSASSTVEAPVARRLRESLGGAKPAAEKATADGNGAPAKKAAAKAPTPEKAPAPKPAAPVESAARTPSSPRHLPQWWAPVAESAPAAATLTHRPHAGSAARNSGSQAGAAHTARRQQPVLLGAAGQRGDSTAPGTPTGRTATRRRPPTRRIAGQHAAPSSRWSTRSSAVRAAARVRLPVVAARAAVPVAAVVPVVVAAVTTAPVDRVAADPVAVAHPQEAAAIAVVLGGGGRPGQRGGAAGAFGRPGGAPKRGRKWKRAKRAEYENMQAPVVGGVRLPHGNGETVRLARGASLSDFAEKIDANPAALEDQIDSPPAASGGRRR